MLNVPEEINMIRILKEFKDLRNSNSQVLQISKFEISNSVIKLTFTYNQTSQYLLNFEYSGNKYNVSFFDITKRAIRLKLSEGKEIQSIANYLNADENSKLRNKLLIDSAEVSSQTNNFEGFLFIYVVLINNIVKNGISILANEIHELEDGILFNYDNKITIILGSQMFSLTYDQSYSHDLYENGEKTSGFSMYYETLLDMESNDNNEFSVNAGIINKIQKVEDEYFGK